MKILITGTFCSGKTTLCYELNKVLGRSLVIPEHPRELLDTFVSVDWNCPELRDYLIIHQLYAERKNFNPETIQIVDAGVISNIAHDKVLSKNFKDRRRLLETFKHDPYDLVFLCNYDEIPLLNDNQRFTDEKLRVALNQEVVLALNEYEYPDYILLSGTIEVRMKLVLHYISKFIKEEC